MLSSHTGKRMTIHSPIRLGLVGCGKVAQNRHLPCLKSLPDVHIAALADIDVDCLNAVADRFQVARRYNDYEALMADPTLDVVAICLPAAHHVKAASLALEAGKHVFIEKPLSLCQDEAAALIAAAAKSSQKIMVGFNLRWHRHILRAREILQSGSLGPIKLVRFLFTTGIGHSIHVPEWKKRRRLGGGVLIENAVHCFDLLRFLFACEVAEIFVQSRSSEWDDETATVNCKLENGILAAVQLSETTADCKEMEIYGDNGRIHISLYRFDGIELLPAGQFPGDVRTRLKGLLNSLKDLSRAIPNILQGGELQSSFYAQWTSFIDCIKYDHPVPCDLQDGLRALQVSLAAVRSALGNQPVAVYQAPRNIEAAISG